MADKYLKVDIITPQSVVYSGDAVSVNVPGSYSPFEVLINHAPIVSSLDTGVIKIMSSENKLVYFAAGTGFVEVNDNKVSILVENAVNADEIDKDKVIEAIGNLKNEISVSSAISDKLLFSSNLAYRQAQLKAATMRRVN
ncbi:MAG: ATP synthase F1 subunit epsilon [Candidatus Kapabacteria bacterium]|nr:ATP synthase F1 subunit epsilon [Ignavibacteriota bacterium]MCW5884114.1 ATP synthase F1 subunit epsilon [Candidatus Kapabacteria bacterium]